MSASPLSNKSFQVKTANPPDEGPVVSAMVLAFSADPAVRWLYQDPHEYLANWPSFVRAFGGRALECGTAHYIEGFIGAALWLPPAVHPDEDALVTLIQKTAREAAQADVFAVLEQMGSYHPNEPHWHLPLIGVDPAWQRQGIGSALLQHALAVCDRDKTLAYLESSNPANIPLYKRHGFEVVGTIQAGASPSLWPMVRRPR